MSLQRRASLILAFAIGATVLIGPSPTVVFGGSLILPDLGMLAPKDFSVQQRPRGVRWLRFDTVVVNVGPGVFEVEGSGAPPGDGTLPVVTQLVDDGSATRVRIDTPASMFHAGDGHDHWHVADLQEWTIARWDSQASVLARGAKTGFCFWDNYRFGSSADPHYHPTTTSACEDRGDGVVPMGLSVGWGDEYPSNIAYQYIDITGLPMGDYLVTLRADWRGDFVEANENNNSAWARIKLSRKGVSVVASGSDLAP